MEIFRLFLQEIYLEEKEIDVDYLGALIGVPLLTKKFHFWLSLSLSLSLSIAKPKYEPWAHEKGIERKKDLYKAVDILDSPWP